MKAGVITSKGKMAGTTSNEKAHVFMISGALTEAMEEDRQRLEVNPLDDNCIQLDLMTFNMMKVNGNEGSKGKIER